VINIVQYEDVNSSDQEMGQARPASTPWGNCQWVPSRTALAVIRLSLFIALTVTSSSTSYWCGPQDRAEGLEREAAHKNAMTVLRAAGGRACALTGPHKSHSRPAMDSYGPAHRTRT